MEITFFFLLPTPIVGPVLKSAPPPFFPPTHSSAADISCRSVNVVLDWYKQECHEQTKNLPQVTGRDYIQRPEKGSGIEPYTCCTEINHFTNWAKRYLR